MKRKDKILHLAALTTAIGTYLALATDALAQSSRYCGQRQTVLGRLADRYGETRQSIGISANNSVVEVFASDDTGSWTIITTTAEGISCLVASGQSFEKLAEEVISSKGNDT